MSKHMSLIALPLLLACGLPAAFCLGLCLAAAPAQARLSRTFVSAATGNDANNCDRATPCRTFQGAHDKTDEQGEITVLDPGHYGPVVITKSISIVNGGGGEAGILVSAGATGVTIDAPAAASVNLRGLAIQGIGFGGSTGLVFNSGQALSLTNCVVRDHTADGIEFMPTGSSRLALANTLVADNAGFGIVVQPRGAGAVQAELDRLEIHNNTSVGLFVNGEDSTGTVDAIVRESVAANNGYGLFVNSTAERAPTTLTMVRTVAADSRGNGIVATGPTATLRVGASTITGNSTSWAVRGGAVVQSFGDDEIAGNGDRHPAPMARGK